MNRMNQILAAVLALQIVLVGVVFWPRPASSITSGESLLAGLQADQFVRLTIRSVDGEEIQLVKRPEGWVLPAADDYPTQGNKVPELLDKILALKANRLVTQTPASHKRLKVANDAFERRIELELNDGTTRTLYLGTSPSYQVVHVRTDGRDEVYLASGLSASDLGARPSNWVDTLFFSVVQDQIVAMTLENENGRFEFEKDDAGTWTMKGLAPDETLKENSIQPLITRVSSVRMLRPLGTVEREDYGLKAPKALVTVQTRDPEGNAKTYTLRIGAQGDEDASYVLASSESPYFVRAADYTVGPLVQRTRDDFIQLPETPTPEPTAETVSGGG